MLASQKNEPQTSSTGLATRLRGSPLKSQHLNKFEDYNDSGYGGSPLPGKNIYINFNCQPLIIKISFTPYQDID